MSGTTFSHLCQGSRLSRNLSRGLTSKSNEKHIAECYQILNIPANSKQDAVRKAFLELAKKYHPDSGSPEANMETFVSVERAFRTLTKHNTGSSSKEEVKKIVYDIKHTAPQHRTYLSYDGVGSGTPYQRQKQYQQYRALKAASNVLDHRVAKAIASENTLLDKNKARKHDIKTNAYSGLERLVEDLIQESMSKGEFENLSGKGKPLKEQNTNPYVDFMTHKINEVLINNGFTPEWITMRQEIEQDIEFLKKDIKTERMYLGPYPLNETDLLKWQKICDENRHLAKTINSKINKYNLIVPLMDKQKFQILYDNICDDILKNGTHSVTKKIEEKPVDVPINNDDLFGVLSKAVGGLFNFDRKK